MGTMGAEGWTLPMSTNMEVWPAEVSVSRERVATLHRLGVCGDNSNEFVTQSETARRRRSALSGVFGAQCQSTRRKQTRYNTTECLPLQSQRGRDWKKVPLSTWSANTQSRVIELGNLTTS